MVKEESQDEGEARRSMRKDKTPENMKNPTKLVKRLSRDKIRRIGSSLKRKVRNQSQGKVQKKPIKLKQITMIQTKQPKTVVIEGEINIEAKPFSQEPSFRDLRPQAMTPFKKQKTKSDLDNTMEYSQNSIGLDSQPLSAMPSKDILDHQIQQPKKPEYQRIEMEDIERDLGF